MKRFYIFLLITPNRTLSSDQEMNIDEGEVTCSSTEDVCVGRMQLTAVNVTESGSSTKLQGFKVKIRNKLSRT